MNAELTDTHAHFEAAREETIEIFKRAREAGVSRIMAVGGSEKMNEGVRRAATIAKENPMEMPGIWQAVGWCCDELDKDERALDLSELNAIGEIGLDYFYSPETRDRQLDLFARQLELAKKCNLPVLIHTRDADDDTIGLLREIQSFGLIHCFTGNVGFCRKLLDLGFYVSISGIVTFKSANNVRESAVFVPDDKLLIETDAPYLAPVPMRGKQNESSYIIHTAKFLADLRKIKFEDFARMTTINAKNLFS